MDDYLEIVIHHAQRHPTKESEGAVVCIKDHFLGFARIGRHEHLAAVGQPEVCDFHRLWHACDLDLLVTPVELANLAWRKTQWHKSLGRGWLGGLCLPAFHKALHAVIRAAIAFSLQAFE